MNLMLPLEEVDSQCAGRVVPDHLATGPGRVGRQRPRSDCDERRQGHPRSVQAQRYVSCYEAQGSGNETDADSADYDRFNPFRVGLDHLALTVENPGILEDLKRDLDAAEVRNHGVEEDPETHDGYISFYDPDGIAWELSAILPHVEGESHSRSVTRTLSRGRQIG